MYSIAHEHKSFFALGNYLKFLPGLVDTVQKKRAVINALAGDDSEDDEDTYYTINGERNHLVSDFNSHHPCRKHGPLRCQRRRLLQFCTAASQGADTLLGPWLPAWRHCRSMGLRAPVIAM